MHVMWGFRQNIFLFFVFISSISSSADECKNKIAQEISVEIDTSRFIRLNSPKEIFGFNLPWRDFQQGYYRNGDIRPELINYLLPFKGASYRYPGGSPSNSFEWRKSIGPIKQRTPLHADFDRYSVAEFGLSEFVSFVIDVNGRAILTLNLLGPYKKAPLSPNELASDTVEMLEYIKGSTAFACVGGATCRLMAVELGNELDWQPFNWPAAIYIGRANSVVSAASNVMPEIQWIANGRTAPWDAKAPDYKSYNTAISLGLNGRVQAIAIHPYYDGIDIPAAAQYVNDFGNTWATSHASSQVFITEHARWPTIPARGEWKTNWFQATGLGGAIASSDFLLTLMTNTQVAAANWHALGLSGPWQLIRLNKEHDQLYPSPVYWGLRAIREAYLDHVVSTRYRQPSATSYSGGYDLKLLGMVDADAKHVSVLGINRNTAPLVLNIRWTGGPRKAGVGKLKVVSGNSMADDNTDLAPQKITMKSIFKEMAPSRSTSNWCVPGQSVFSILEP